MYVLFGFDNMRLVLLLLLCLLFEVVVDLYWMLAFVTLIFL